MKITVVTDRKGEIVGAMYGHTPEPDTSESVPEQTEEKGAPTYRAGLMAGPDQKIHVVEVKDELLQVELPGELEKVILRVVRKSKK